MLHYSTLLLLTLSSVVKLQEPTPRGPPGSQETTHNDSTILPLPSGNLSFPINESSISAPIVGRNESLLNLKERPQSPPAANQTFPRPTLALAKMVEKAKVFKFFKFGNNFVAIFKQVFHLYNVTFGFNNYEAKNCLCYRFIENRGLSVCKSTLKRMKTMPKPKKPICLSLSLSMSMSLSLGLGLRFRLRHLGRWASWVRHHCHELRRRFSGTTEFSDPTVTYTFYIKN